VPWKDIFLWTFYSWIGSFAGLGFIVHLASTHAENYTYQQICNLSFRHVMDLSMDFHSNKDSGEVIKSVDQAESLCGILRLLMFDILPIFLDLSVAVWYVPYLFGPYMGFLVLTLGVAYVWSGVSLTTWSQPKRRKFVETARAENSTYRGGVWSL
jgi:ABC-type transport system involved in Fe-S cluster assembly fused permease/ATPase subunit